MNVKVWKRSLKRIIFGLHKTETFGVGEGGGKEGKGAEGKKKEKKKEKGVRGGGN